MAERLQQDYQDPSVDDEDRHLTTVVVHRLLRKLSQQDQLCLWLFYFGGWSTHDIATEMGITNDAVKTRLVRARRRFRQLWKEDES